MDDSVSGTIDQKTYLKKFRVASSPLAHPGSAYGHSQGLANRGSRAACSSCPVSRGCYVITVFIRVDVANFLPIVHLESRGTTYTRDATYAMRESVLGDLCKHMRTRAYLRDTRVSYRVDVRFVVCARTYTNDQIKACPRDAFSRVCACAFAGRCNRRKGKATQTVKQRC